MKAERKKNQRIKRKNLIKPTKTKAQNPGRNLQTIISLKSIRAQEGIQLKNLGLMIN